MQIIFSVEKKKQMENGKNKSEMVSCKPKQSKIIVEKGKQTMPTTRTIRDKTSTRCELCLYFGHASVNCPIVIP